LKVVSVKKQQKVKYNTPQTNVQKVKKVKKQVSSKKESEEVNSANPNSSKSKKTNGKANTGTSQHCKSYFYYSTYVPYYIVRIYITVATRVVYVVGARVYHCRGQ